MSRVILVLLLPCFSSSALAHHSTRIAYDLNDIGTIEGRVTSIFWRNPHVLLTLERIGENGDSETWEVESGSPNSLQRIGIGSDILTVGDHVSVTGALSRQGLTSMAGIMVVLPDGREVALWPQRAASLGRTLGVDARELISSSAVERSQREAEGIFRVWSRTVGLDWTLPFTPEAAAARGTWDPLVDDPALKCIPPGMPSMMDNPYPIEFSGQGETITLRLEEWDGIRIIHMGDDAASGPVPSRTGYSKGHWDGKTLVVTTTGVSYPYFDADGTPQSEAVEIVEEFTLSDDERRLDYYGRITDAQTFTEPATVSGFWVWVPGEEIKPYNCTLPEP
jgi:hypothetical protein